MNSRNSRIINLNKDSSCILIKIIDVLKSGGTVIYPTETFYGIGVDASSNFAVNKLYKIKQRDYLKPVPVIAADFEMFKKYFKDILKNDLFQKVNKLSAHFWPGPLTLIFSKPKSLASQLNQVDNTVGIRIPGYEFARKICEEFNGIITSTSANISNELPASDISQISSLIIDNVDLIIDAGTLNGQLASTVIKITDNSFEVLRKGMIKESSIKQLLSL